MHFDCTSGIFSFIIFHFLRPYGSKRPEVERGEAASLGEAASRHPPPSQHGEDVKAVSAVFLYRHRQAEHHPARGFFRWDSQRLVGVDAGQAGDVGDVGLRIVLARRCPARDDGSDGVEPVLVIIGTGEQVEGGAPTILQIFELAETVVVLRFR